MVKFGEQFASTMARVMGISSWLVAPPDLTQMHSSIVNISALPRFRANWPLFSAENKKAPYDAWMRHRDRSIIEQPRKVMAPVNRERLPQLIYRGSVLIGPNVHVGIGARLECLN
jgi:hypothetical protein